MSGSRPFPEIREDFPDCPDEAMYALADEVLAWLADSASEPSRGWDPMLLACTGALTDLNAAGAVLNSLISEWRSSRPSPAVYSAGLGELNVARGVVSEVKPTFEKAVAALKARHVQIRQAQPNNQARWRAAPAAVIALRRIDLALVYWRNGDGSCDDDKLLSEINDIVSDWYEAGPPDEDERAAAERP